MAALLTERTHALAAQKARGAEQTLRRWLATDPAFLAAYCADSARFVFGDSTGDRVADDILEYLRGAGDVGMTRAEISNAVSRHLGASRLTEALTTLHRAGRARVERVATEGRPAERWHATTGGRP